MYGAPRALNKSKFDQFKESSSNINNNSGGAQQPPIIASTQSIDKNEAITIFPSMINHHNSSNLKNSDRLIYGKPYSSSAPREDIIYFDNHNSSSTNINMFLNNRAINNY